MEDEVMQRIVGILASDPDVVVLSAQKGQSASVMFAGKSSDDYGDVLMATAELVRILASRADLEPSQIAEDVGEMAEQIEKSDKVEYHEKYD